MCCNNGKVPTLPFVCLVVVVVVVGLISLFQWEGALMSRSGKRQCAGKISESSNC